MNKIYVVAGTYHEAKEWIKQDIPKRYATNTSLTLSDYVYISKAEDLNGVTDPHGVFIGNWLGRPDILEIVQQLMTRAIHVNPALINIYKQVKPKIRPTPKLTGNAYTNVWIDEAAELLSKEIDAEVIKQFNGGDMTNRYNEVRKAMESL